MTIEKIDLILDKINDQKESNNKRLDAIDANLLLHMKRCDELETLNRNTRVELSERIDILEEPKKVRTYIYKTLIAVGAVAAIILTALRIKQLLGV